jgi:hypothetical protein
MLVVTGNVIVIDWNILQLGEESVTPTTFSSTGDENTPINWCPSQSRQEQASETLAIENTSKSESFRNDQVGESTRLLRGRIEKFLPCFV